MLTVIVEFQRQVEHYLIAIPDVFPELPEKVSLEYFGLFPVPFFVVISAYRDLTGSLISEDNCSLPGVIKLGDGITVAVSLTSLFHGELLVNIG